MMGLGDFAESDEFGKRVDIGIEVGGTANGQRRMFKKRFLRFNTCAGGAKLVSERHLPFPITARRISTHRLKKVPCARHRPKKASEPSWHEDEHPAWP